MAKLVNASATWADGERFVVSASSGHAFVVDADRERNTGPGPMELVLIGLCACTATDVASILRKSASRSRESRCAPRAIAPMACRRYTRPSGSFTA
jgi:uncharacterized OsmC-like protein